MLCAQAAGFGSGGEEESGRRAKEHAGLGGRLQKEVRASAREFPLLGD